MRHPTQKLAALLILAAMVLSLLPATALAAPETHIATYINEVPALLADDTSIAASQFSTPYDAVTVTSGGVSYTVEVLPKNTVYFIDCVDKDETKNASTEAYAAAAALLGDKLLNTRNDQYKTDSNTWGLVDRDAGVKSYTSVADKMNTGFYGAQNVVGETLSYQFALPAGVYRLKSGHTEWWSQTRPMSTKVVLENGKVVDGSDLRLTSSSTRVYNEMGFVLDQDQTITYTVTSTGGQAPVVSYIGIDKIGDYTPPSTEAPEQPTLPAGFTEALEEIDGLEMAGTTLKVMSGCGKIVEATLGWNNQGSGGANFIDAQNLFGRPAFTLLADVYISPTQNGNLLADLIAAFGIGNATDYINGFSHSGKINVKGVWTDLEGFIPAFLHKWNCMALCYEEAEGLEGGKLTVYLNGKKAAEIPDTGFKFSTMEDLGATLGRSFATNYVMNGFYDNIVVGGTALDENTAKAETAYRLYQKENLPADTSALEAAIAQANLTIEAGITSTELEAVLAEALSLLASNPKVDDQATVDDMTARLKQAITNARAGYIFVTGDDVTAAAANVNGLTYKGFGLLNCNGTSNLLMDYKSENPEVYWEMMNFLFGGEHPLFSHVKMEMGNDGNNSTAADACVMRWADEEADVSRSPGFAMAADAKKLNPDLKISILNWGQPNWVTNNDTKYVWYRETIFDCYEKYGYVLDYVNPDVNESNPNATRIKFFSEKFKNETEFPPYFTQEAIDAYHNIKIIASDENKGLNIVPLMRSDPGVYEAVDAIGFHYRTSATQDYINMADIDDKEVWYSEGCATFGYTELQENKTDANGAYGAGTIGGHQSPLALMDHFINGFMASRRTLYIFQPAIGGFYEGIQYAHKELLSARDPWSGYIHYDPALLMLEHFAKFGKIGWENADNSNGIWRALSSASFASYGGSDNEHATAGANGNASYLTLAAPDKSGFSTIFVNNTQNEKSFKLKAVDLALNTDSLNIWVTQTDSYMQQAAPVALENGYWNVTVPAFSILTATTLGNSPEALPKSDIRVDERTVLDTDSTGKVQDLTDDYLYADDFEYEGEEADVPVYNNVTGETTMVPYLQSRGNEPRYMVDSHGAFVVVNGKLKQLLTSSVSQWNSGDPMTILGDYRWNDYEASVTVSFAEATKTGTSSWAGLTVRSQAGMNYNTDGYTLRLVRNGSVELRRNNSRVSPRNLTIPTTADEVYVLRIVAQGPVITAYVNDTLIYSYTDATPWDAGRVKLSCAWDSVSFDDLEIKTLQGGQDYVLTHLDGQDDSVVYEGGWKHAGPGNGSADNWYRTLTTNTAAGAKATVHVTGTGLGIIGPNTSSVINVYVDGELVAENVATLRSGTRQATYRLEGLPYGEYDITVEVVSGTLTIDAFYMLGMDVSDRLIDDVEDIELRHNVSLGSDLVINFRLVNNAGLRSFDSYYLEFIRHNLDGTDSTVLYGEGKDEDLIPNTSSRGTAVLSYDLRNTSVPVAELGVSYSVVFHGFKDGVEYVKEPITGSLLDYFAGQLETIEPEALNGEARLRLAADTLLYAAKAQAVFNPDDAPILERLSQTALDKLNAYGTQTAPEAVNEISYSDDGLVNPNLRLSLLYRLEITARYTNKKAAAPVVVEYWPEGLEDQKQTISATLKNSTWSAAIGDIGAAQIRTPYHFRFLSDGVPVTNEAVWSIASYVASSRDAADAPMAALYNAILAFGDSVVNLFG